MLRDGGRFSPLGWPICSETPADLLRETQLDAPERMKQVFLGVQFQDGVEVKREEVFAVA